MQQVGNTYSPYFAPSPIMPTLMGPGDPTGVGSPLGVVQQTVAMPQKMPLNDRLEVCLPPNYIQHGAQARLGTQRAITGPNAAVYQVPLNQVSPVSTMQSVNPSPSPTAITTTSFCNPLHNPNPHHHPLHNLVYVHAYY